MKKVIAGILTGLSFAPLVAFAIDRGTREDRPDRQTAGERDRGSRPDVDRSQPGLGEE